MSLFISIECFDGTGNSTQASILKKNLDDLSIDSILVREPGSTSFSEKIREILIENTEIETLTELLLFQASRSELVKKVIIPNLESGKVVITDRFSDSYLAYQGYGGGLDIKLIEFPSQSVHFFQHIVSKIRSSLNTCTLYSLSSGAIEQSNPSFPGAIHSS